MSEATLLQYQQKLSEKLQSEMDAIRQDFIFTEVLHKDKSGVRINGILHLWHEPFYRRYRSRRPYNAEISAAFATLR